MTLGGFDFHVIDGSVDLEDLVLIQKANPDPPVALFSRAPAPACTGGPSCARVVAHMEFERPVLYIDRAHFEAEAADDVPAAQRGGQDALQAAYPFKINLFMVTDGTLTYVDNERARPPSAPTSC